MGNDAKLGVEHLYSSGHTVWCPWRFPAGNIYMTDALISHIRFMHIQFSDYCCRALILRVWHYALWPLRSSGKQCAHWATACVREVAVALLHLLFPMIINLASAYPVLGGPWFTDEDLLRTGDSSPSWILFSGASSSQVELKSNHHPDQADYLARTVWIVFTRIYPKFWMMLDHQHHPEHNTASAQQIWRWNDPDLHMCSATSKGSATRTNSICICPINLGFTVFDITVGLVGISERLSCLILNKAYTQS